MPSSRAPSTIIASLLIFSIGLGPTSVAFAQTTDSQTLNTQTPPADATPAPASSDAQKSDASQNAPAQSQDAKKADGTSLTPAVATDKPDQSDKAQTQDAKSTPKDTSTVQTAAATSVSTTPNSPREVLQGIRNGISSMVDTLTGALIYKYPIAVPPGRNSLAPDLHLVYNSADANNESPFGSGWSIDIPYIQRLNKQGTDSLYAADDYTSSLSGELAPVSGSTFAPKVEDGRFLTYTKNANGGWTVVDKNGTTYTFGSTTQARQDNASSTTQVYKWMLEEVRDTNNNYISFEYTKDSNQIYPSKITYTGNGSTPGVMTVNFVKTARSGAPKQYGAAFPVQTNYQITEIRTEVQGVWAHKYSLTYANSDYGPSTLLNTIVESGQDDVGSITTLPPITFGYSTSTPGWTYNAAWNLPIPMFAAGDIGARMADINGDGLPDIVQHQYNTSNNSQVFISTGGGWTAGDTGIWSTPSFTDSSNNDTGLRLVDVNGDGLTDLAQGNYSTNTVSLNSGAGWTLSSWQLPVPFVGSGAKDIGMRMGDINGDGLPDIVCHNNLASQPCGGNTGTVYINTGGGWTLSSTYSLPYMPDWVTKQEFFIDSNGLDAGLRLVDINGDGLADLVRSSPAGRYVYINTGTTWVYDPSWYPPTFIDSNNADTGARMFDQNGDLYTDFMVAHGNSNGGTSDSAKNTYTNWVGGGYTMPRRANNSSIYETFVDYAGQDNGVRAIDVDGDGMVDIVHADASFKYTYTNNTTTPVNYLRKITYPQGGNVAITYKASSQMKDASGHLLNLKLPIVNTVVSHIAESDGVTPITHDFSYTGGLLYFKDSRNKKFAGFASITDTDGAGNVTKTYFHQGDTSSTTLGEFDDQPSKIGKPYRIEEYDSSGHLMRVTINKWDRYVQDANRDFVKLAATTILNYDGDSTHVDSATEYTYDNTNGNNTQVVNWGAVNANTDGSFTDAGSDKSTENISYAVSTTTPVTGLPYLDTLLDQNGNKVKETRTYYDGLPLGSATKGNLTKVEQWVTGSTYINTKKSYDPTYGIVLSDTDPRGKVTSYTYDPYNLYPATTTDPLAHKTTYLYDYSIGKPKQTKDQNGFLYKTVYDGLDRVVEEKIPGSTSPFTPVVKTAYIYTDTPNAFAVHEADYLDASTTADTYDYFDGLGRLLQERKKAETNYNVRDFSFNNRGLLSVESLPYVVSGSSLTPAAGADSLYVYHTYDALSRPLSLSNAVGTTEYAYNDWKTTVTDPRGKTKVYYNDARNNLIQVDEINNGSTYSTFYNWDLNGNLLKITDALGNVRNFTYDGLGNRLTAEDLHLPVDATFGTWHYTYDNAGNVTKVIDPKNQTINNTYDNINRLLTKDYTGSTGVDIKYTYDACTYGIGQVCSAVVQGTATTTYAYNSLGLPSTNTRTIDGVAYTTKYTYDRQGNTTLMTLPDNLQINYIYNNAGTVNQITRKFTTDPSPVTVISNVDYAPQGSVSLIAFANAMNTTNTYDPNALYRMSAKTTCAGQCSAIASSTPATTTTLAILVVGGGGGGGGKVTRFGTAYGGGGGAGGFIETTNQSVPVGSYAITVGAGGQGGNNSAPNGNNGTSSSFGPLITGAGGGGGGADNGGANFGANGASGGGGAGGALGASVGGGSGTVGQGNNGGSGRTASGSGYRAGGGGGGAGSIGGNSPANSVGGNGGSGSMSAITGFSYAGGGGGAGDFSSGSATDGGGTGGASSGTSGTDGKGGGGGGGGNATGYAATGGNGGSGVVVIRYPSAQATNFTCGGATTTSGTSTICTYTSNGTFAIATNTTSVTTGAGSGAQNLSYTYDADGNITNILDSSNTAASKTIDYTYDDLNRLLTASTTAANSASFRQIYAYDALGDLTNKSDIGAYTYAGTGYANPHAPTSIAGVPYAYDNDGNLASAGASTYTWDFLNRLTSAASGQGTTTYAYDQDGARIKQVANGETTVYPSDAYSIVSKTIGATTYATSTDYISVGDTLVASIDQARINGTATGTPVTSYIHTDHLGSTNVITDSSGNVVAAKDYYPYGSLRVNSGSASLKRGYIGQFEDASALDYLNARYYDSNRGQFTSEDPVFWEVGQTQDGKAILPNPQAMNSYSYSGDNPIINKDPTGRCLEDLCIGEGILVGLALYGGYSAGTDLYQGYTSGDSKQFTWGLVGAGTSMVPGGAEYKGAATLAEDALKVGAKTAAERLAENQAVGLANEVASGYAKNTLRIPSLTGTANYRVPDIFDPIGKEIGDIKSVKYLSNTPQMRDFTSFAKQNNFSFTLVTGPATRISQPLMNVLTQLGATVKKLDAAISSLRNTKP